VYATDNEKIDAIKMEFVQSIEFRRVALRGFDKKTLVAAWRRGFLCRTSDDHHGSAYSNCLEDRKVTERFFGIKAGEEEKRFTA
jgi:hypothetical protein